LLFYLTSLSYASIQDAQPEAAEFEVAKSGSQDLYTGDMSFSIPILKVPGRNGLDLPLDLVYNAGIRVDQEASWVGLGWNLGVGMISRSVNREPDDLKDFGYLRTGIEYNALTQRGDLGGAQDNYFLSFGAGGGRMILENSYNTDEYRGTAHLEFWKPWNITYYMGNNEITAWIVTTEDGTKYIFDYPLKTQNKAATIYHAQKQHNEILNCPCVPQYSHEINTPQRPCGTCPHLQPPYNVYNPYGTCPVGGEFLGGYYQRSCDYACGTGCRNELVYCDAYLPPGGSPIFTKLLPSNNTQKDIINGNSISNVVNKLFRFEENDYKEQAQQASSQPIFRSPLGEDNYGTAQLPLCRDSLWDIKCQVVDDRGTTNPDDDIVTKRIYEQNVTCSEPSEQITYTSSWLLTRILSPDYVDNSPSGPSINPTVGPEDYGNWINISYVKLINPRGGAEFFYISSFPQPVGASDYVLNATPYCYWFSLRSFNVPPYNSPMYTDPLAWKRKLLDCEMNGGGPVHANELFRYTSLAKSSSFINFAYLSKIITPTHTARFFTFERENEIFSDPGTWTAPIPARGLDYINLYKRVGANEQGELIKIVDFSYSDTKLAQNHHYYPDYKGKLTLGGLQFKGPNWELDIPPYYFEYYEDAEWWPYTKDNWGYYNAQVRNSGGLCTASHVDDYYDSDKLREGPTCDDFNGDQTKCDIYQQTNIGCFYDNNNCCVKSNLDGPQICYPAGGIGALDPLSFCWGIKHQNNCNDYLNYPHTTTNSQHTGCAWGSPTFNHGQGNKQYFCCNDAYEGEGVHSPKCGINKESPTPFIKTTVPYRFDCAMFGYNTDKCQQYPGCWAGMNFTSNNSAIVWSLTNITYPTGGTVSYTYEVDDYSYIQTNQLPVDQLGGGIRINSITTDNGLGDISKENFKYKFSNGRSSGVATLIPNLTAKDFFAFSNVAPSMQNVVTYASVTEDLPSSYGRKVTEFYTAKDLGYEDLDIDLTFGRPHSDRSWKRGMKKFEANVDESGITKSNVSFSYLHDEVVNYHTFQSPMCIGNNVECSQRNPDKCNPYLSPNHDCRVLEGFCVGPEHGCIGRSHLVPWHPNFPVDEEQCFGAYDDRNRCLELTENCEWLGDPCGILINDLQNAQSTCNAAASGEPWHMCYGWSTAEKCVPNIINGVVQPIFGCNQFGSEEQCINGAIGCSWTGDNIKYSGWTKISSANESLDGVSKITNYEYPPSNLWNLFNGLPYKTTERNSDTLPGIRIITTKYMHENSGTLQSLLRAKNMLILPIYEHVYNTTEDNNGRMVYKSYEYNNNFAGNNINQVYKYKEKSWLDQDDQGDVDSSELITTVTYLDYDNYGNLLKAANPLRQADNSATQYFYEGNLDPCDDIVGTNSQFANAYLTCIKNYNGYKVKNRYFDDGMLQSVEGFNNDIIRYEYDHHNRLTQVFQPGYTGARTTYSYRYPSYGITPTTLNKIETMEIINSQTYLLSATYADGLGRKINGTIKNYANSQEIFSDFIYNDISSISKVRNPHLRNSQPTTQIKNIFEDSPTARLKEGYPLGNINNIPTTLPVTYQYSKTQDGKFRTVLSTDQNGKKVKEYYDSFNLLKKIEKASGTAIQDNIIFNYDILGHLTNLTDDNGQQTIYVYDTLGRLVTKEDPNSGITTYQYDNNNNLLMKNHQGYITNYQYDLLDRLVAKTYYDETPSINYIYDTYPTNVMLECGEILLSNNALGKLLIKKVENVVTECFEYGDNGQITKQIINIRAGQNTGFYRIRYEYDLDGNIIKIIYPDNKAITYSLNNYGQVYEIASNNYLFNPSFETNNDNNNDPDYWTTNGVLQIKRHETTPLNVQFGTNSYYFQTGASNSGIYQGFNATYNQQYLLSLWVKGSGQLNIRVEDNHAGTIANRLVTLTGSWTNIILPFVSTCSPITTICRNVVTLYNGIGSLQVYIDGVKIEPGNSATPFDANYYFYNFDQTIDSVKNGNSIIEEYEYNERKWLNSLKIFTPTNTLLERAFNYYEAGNLKEVLVPGNLPNPKQAFEYDDQQRIKKDRFNALFYAQGQSNENYDLLFTYDDVGNRRTQIIQRVSVPTPPIRQDTYTYNPNNKNWLTIVTRTPDSPTSNPDYTFNYDGKGNVITKTVGPPYKSSMYTYDSENRLTRVEFSDGSFSRYMYNPDGLQIYKYDSFTNREIIYIRAFTGEVLYEKYKEGILHGDTQT